MIIEWSDCGEPSGNCPVQAEGRVNGLPFYFRARGTHWSLSIAKRPDGDPLEYEECYRYSETYKGNMYVEGDRFCAGWAEKQECVDFIVQTASRLLGETKD